MSNTSSQPSPESASIRPPLLLRKMAVVTFLLVALMLSTLNVLTLVNQDAHTVGYDLLSDILFSIASESTASRILQKSPTNHRQAGIKSATKALADERTALLAANKVMEARHASLDRAHKEIIAKHAALERAHEALVVKHADLSKTHRNLETAHGNLKAKQVRQANVARTFSANLARRTVTGATRNVGSVMPRSVPYAGAAMVVTIAGLDLYDACETMRQLDALNQEFDGTHSEQQKVCGLRIPSIN